MSSMRSGSSVAFSLLEVASSSIERVVYIVVDTDDLRVPVDQNVQVRNVGSLSTPLGNCSEVP